MSSIRAIKANTYVTALVGVHIDTVERLLRVANDSNDTRIKSIISIEDDFHDFMSKVASMTKDTQYLPSPGMKVSWSFLGQMVNIEYEPSEWCSLCPTF